MTEAIAVAQSTSCPGALGKSQNTAYMARVQAWYDSMCGGAAAPSEGSSTSTETAVSGDADDLARRVINGEFGNGEARKAALGERYAEV